MTLQQFCLRWNNHQPNFISVFTNLLNNEALVDVTLAAEGQHLQAHRVVLSACSSYFQSLFTVNPCQHPIVILKDVNFSDLKIMVDFMYYGEVNVSQEQLPAILETAKMLKIKGLTEMPDNCDGASGAFRFSKSSSMSLDKADPVASVDSRRSPSPAPSSPSGAAGRRKRLRKSSSGSGSGSTAGERTSGETLSEVTIVPAAAVKSEVDPASPRPHRPHHAPALRNATHDASTDSERRDGSQESYEEDMLSMHGSQDSSTGAGEGPVPVADTGPWASTSQDTSGQAVRTSGKHRRLLTRQPRVKKESDPLHTTSPEREPQSPQFPSSAPPCPHQPPLLVTVPPPACAESCPSPLLSTRIPAHNLLSVPQPAYLVKQHSHPLLPSQKSSHAGAVHRQLSTPTPGTSAHPPPLQVHFVATVQPREYALRVASPPPMRDLSEAGRNSTGLRARGVDELRRASSSPQVPTSREEGFEPRSVHCPMLRPGPALGCNFCWNTIDAHGRILRRKTKYHCPECQTNLCIVPCFQEYHEKHSPGSSRDTTGAISPTVLKSLLPKTSSI